ncbi:NADH dehydrogenase subunit 5 [Caenorhabditis elegans]|uniref:NADH dehydrogenase subunit 5 n=1 Tax=Caenorhabditis elegans TaxID=6239 RepID=A0A061AE10_CAEEL|nr:NADH dehydrogenase subunit 5 [Caenorhabditis elegans]CDR32734.1 NADH dehydrogenase subunit 5 [Caenorhabditis elegans]|eukprot:NP_001293293.1 Uncharacterized protein CELE_Y23H5A.8 [Caenorhabditis elegans]
MLLLLLLLLSTTQLDLLIWTKGPGSSYQNQSING